jgi:hypothetical protein
MRQSLLRSSVAVLLFAAASWAQAPPETELVIEESVLAVVTHKAGLAAGLAHDHLVVAESWKPLFHFAPGRPEATEFSVEVPVADLVIDDPALQQKWFPALAALGVLGEEFRGASQEDRTKIRDAMLSRGQLDPEHHPDLRARLLQVSPEVTTVGTVEHGYRLRVEISLHGVTREETFTARLHRAEGRRRLEALGSLLFSEFGIEPYSAFLGAVRNQDRFHVLVVLTVAD